MAWKVELSGGAERALKAAEKTGWVRTADDLEMAELGRARLVYDGAVTGEGWRHLEQR